MNAKRLFSVSLSVLMAATLLAGCGQKAATTTGSDASKPAATSNGKIYIPVISKGFQHQFWQAVKQGADQAAKDYNVEITFEGPDNETMVDKQVEMLQTALGKNPKAICLAALDSKAVIPLLEKAKASNIPVVGFDSGVDSDIPVATAATDNNKAAAAAADKMAEAIGGKGEVALVVHDQTSQTGVSRRDGFVNEIKAKYPDIKIVDIQYGGGDQLKSTDITKALIQAHPNLKGLFASNEGSAVGVIHGIKELHKEGKIVAIGYDAGKEQKDAVRSGLMYGSVSQDPVGIGYKAVEAAVKAIKGEKIEKNIDTGYKWYDKTNVDSPDLKALLYD